MKRVDIVGKTYNYLEVLRFVGVDKNGHALYECKCSACGKLKVYVGTKVRDGDVKSCGCMHRKYGHNMTDTRLYHIWCTMKARCNNPTAQKYARYGGRGIKLCDAWQRFEPFYEWSMSHGYTETLSIDRINNDGNYEPDNCRWVDNKTQANNTSTNKRYFYNGENYTLSEISSMTSVPYKLLFGRLRRGWNVDDAVNIPKLGGHDLKEYKASMGVA